MKNAIINSLLLIFLSLFINCNKKKTSSEVKKTTNSDTIFQDKIIVFKDFKRLNEDKCLDTYTIKNKIHNYITKFNVITYTNTSDFYHILGFSFYYYDYDELYKCRLESDIPSIDDMEIYFKVIEKNIIIKRIIKKTHWQGRNYMHQLCVKRCNVTLKENDTINWDDFFYKHFHEKDGNSNKYCRDVITDSIEWEENKPR